MIHIVLFEPEIPQNTGNIMRTCVALNAKLHLIEPLGFSLDEKHLKRAGMDYVNDLEYTIYADWKTFETRHPSTNKYYISRYAKQSPDEFDFTIVKDDIYFIFGKESTGIPKVLLQDHLDQCIRLPMVASARSLNLSNCVAIVLYEVSKQLGYPGLVKHEMLKGKDFIST